MTRNHANLNSYMFSLFSQAMALADKYMSSANNIQTYVKAHHQLVVICCLSIAIKVDSPAKAYSGKELSELCQGVYTPAEIHSEEMCILQELAWYLNPPTASQVANHVLALVLNLTGASSSSDWAPFVEQTHGLINSTVYDMELSLLRPSTVAMASILASTGTFRGAFARPTVVRSVLSIMNAFDFALPCEIDSISTSLSHVGVRLREKHLLQTNPQEGSPSLGPSPTTALAQPGLASHYPAKHSFSGASGHESHDKRSEQQQSVRRTMCTGPNSYNKRSERHHSGQRATCTGSNLARSDHEPRGQPRSADGGSGGSGGGQSASSCNEPNLDAYRVGHGAIPICVPVGHEAPLSPIY